MSDETRRTPLDRVPPAGDAQADVQVPALLRGRFEVRELIGEGGLGRVYRGTDLETGISVAIKMIPRLDDRQQGLLLRESRLLRKIGALQDPSLVRFLDIIVEDDTVFLIQEYIEKAEPLSKWQHGRPILEVLGVYRHIANALGRLHAEGVVHRDLKPSNVLVKGSPTQPVIVDFGLAVSTHEVDTLTGGPMLVGTPRYMSPEALAGQPVRAAADVFALGLMLFEAIAGKLPWPGDSIQELMSSLSRGKPQMELLGPFHSSGLAILLEEMLAKNPDERPGTSLLGDRLVRLEEEVQRSPGLSAHLVPVAPTAGPSEDVDTVPNLQVGTGAPVSLPTRPAVMARGPVAAPGVTMTAPALRPIYRSRWLVPLALGISIGAFAVATNLAAPRQILGAVLSSILWIVLVVAGIALVRFTLARRRVLVRPRKDLPAGLLERVVAIEAKVQDADQLTKTLALAIDELGSRIDPARFERVIRESVALALQQLPPAPTAAPTELARALEVIGELAKARVKPRASWVQKLGLYVGVGGGAVTACAGLVGLLGSVNLWRPNHPPEIVSFAAETARIRAGTSLLLVVEAKDPDGDELSFSYSASTGYIVGAGSSAVWTPPQSMASRLVQIKVSVTDGRETVVRQHSIPVNSLPRGRLEVPRDAIRRTTYSLRAVVADPDGDRLTFAWHVAGGTLMHDGAAVVFWRAPNAPDLIGVVCDVSDDFETVTITAEIRVK